jgi:SpoVK/Ycf46/Vps4 family AAA+-type ATPase
MNAFIQKYLSANTSIPKENIDTFNKDLISLTKIDPLQILIIGRAKTGKSALAKAIAKEYNIVHISK